MEGQFLGSIHAGDDTGTEDRGGNRVVIIDRGCSIVRACVFCPRVPGR
jgi:hypothetical protein